MKIFEGKSPAERNKLIAAIVLGVLAVLALTYTFGGMFFGGKPKVTVSTSPTPRPTSSPGSNTNVSMPTQAEEDFAYTSTAIFYNPNALYAPDAGRNIFAFYEPPVPTPYSPTPFVATPFPELPTPTPTPTPPMTLFTAAPANGGILYAGQQGFKLEITGDKFAPNSQVIINNQPFPTTFINSQRLSVDIPASFIATAGNFIVLVNTPDGKLYSNAASFNVQAPPLPQFQYVGVTIRKGNNNNTATIREAQNKESNVRLNDEIGGRFKVVSISKNEIVVQDKFLGFPYRKPMETGSQTSASTTTTNTRTTQNPTMNPTPVNPTNPNCPPGIPCGQYPIYNPNSNVSPIQQKRQQQQTKDDVDDDGNK